MNLRVNTTRRAAAILVPTAAVIVIAVSLCSDPQLEVALAAALQRLRSAETIVCRVSSESPMEIGGLPIEQTGTLYLSQEHGSRMDILANGVLVSTQLTPPTGPLVVLSPLTRTYTRIDASSALPGGARTATPDAWLKSLRSLAAQADREIGRARIDEVEACGFAINAGKLGIGGQVAGAGVDVELWVDPRVELPVEFVVRIAAVGDQPGMTMVYDRFEWDKPLEAALFNADIPDDYHALDVTMPPPSEQMLIRALQFYIDSCGKDHYPVNLNLPAVIGEIVATSIAKDAAVGDEQTITAKSMELAAGCIYLMQLSSEGCNPEYFGKDVAPGDAKAVLVRWKLPDGKTRVIYGDLHAESIE